MMAFPECNSYHVELSVLTVWQFETTGGKYNLY